MARIQTDYFVSQLSEKFPDTEYSIIPITVSGERDYARPIAELGIEGAFVKELEEALLNDEIDIVVHSLKDLPTTLPHGLTLACVTEREDVRDVLVSTNNYSLHKLPTGARVATSSRRRMAQLKAVRDDLVFMDIRGNVPTRIDKMDDGYCDALVLAAAGLIRLGLTNRIAEYLDLKISIPVPGQGALGIECRLSDHEVANKLQSLDNVRTRFAITAERAFLAEIGGGCSMPIGALAIFESLDKLTLTGCITSLDGKQIIRGEMTATATEAEELGVKLANDLLNKGARAIVEKLRALTPVTVSPP
jgi:hydroxymethylbilane synthase